MESDVSLTAPSSARIIESIAGRGASVGGLGVLRALPTRGRRTIGAWCFADQLGPADVDPDNAVGVGPHPHIGLATVTWLLDGELLHRDSLGSEQSIRPGQLNLMTAGRGVQHAEEGTSYTGTFDGIQLWLAQPEATRWGDPAFEHHTEVPHADLGVGTGTVLVGEFAGERSPARADTDAVGVELRLHGTAEIPLRPDFEYGLIVLRGAVSVGDEQLRPGSLGYLGSGAESLALTSDKASRVMLLGGTPFEPITMFWNFVGRDKDELTAAARDWNAADDRFGRITSGLSRIASPIPPWAGSS